MPLLDDANRKQVMAKWMRDQFGTVSITKADVRAAVDALDAWVDTNGAAVNTAIPQPARGALSLAQKSLIFCYVVMRRAGFLPVQGD
jgi:hypothetical protein